jgi:hypothetical protein
MILLWEPCAAIWMERNHPAFWDDPLVRWLHRIRGYADWDELPDGISGVAKEAQELCYSLLVAIETCRLHEQSLCWGRGVEWEG